MSKKLTLYMDSHAEFLSTNGEHFMALKQEVKGIPTEKFTVSEEYILDDFLYTVLVYANGDIEF